MTQHIEIALNARTVEAPGVEPGSTFSGVFGTGSDTRVRTIASVVARWAALHALTQIRPRQNAQEPQGAEWAAVRMYDLLQVAPLSAGTWLVWGADSNPNRVENAEPPSHGPNRPRLAASAALARWSNVHTVEGCRAGHLRPCNCPCFACRDARGAW